MPLLGHLAACYAHVGKLNEANQMTKDIVWHPSFEKFRDYNLALIQTINGDHEKALQSLILAIQSGYYFGFYSYGYDHHLLPLFDNPTFQNLIKVKE